MKLFIKKKKEKKKFINKIKSEKIYFKKNK